MYKSLTKIAITGGPCSGKTTGMAKINSDLSDKGYEVIIIPEAATFIKNSGIKISEEHISFYAVFWINWKNLKIIKINVLKTIDKTVIRIYNFQCN